jgi:hypothetical protein
MQVNEYVDVGFEMLECGEIFVDFCWGLGQVPKFREWSCNVRFLAHERRGRNFHLR